MLKPIPTNNEIVLDPFKTIMSKTDKKGIIEYANDYFMEISGYKEWELMGQAHNIMRHPDMPKAVFKLLWDNIKEGRGIYAIVKNLAKTGDYYWVVADFKIVNNAQGEIESIYARRKAVPQRVKEKIIPIYNALSELEKTSGMEASAAYFNGKLEDAEMTYESFILNMFGLSKTQLQDYMSSEIDDSDIMNGSDSNISAEEAIKKSAKKKGFFGRMFK
jgi:PAS domain S-box-containing protein